MSLDEFTTDALALLAAAGKADFEVATQQERQRSGSYRFWLTTWDPSPSRNPLDCHFSLDYGPTGEAVLGLLAGRLGIAYPLAPVVYATAEQKEDLQRLYNHAFCKRWEKTKMLLDLDRYTQAQAEQMLASGPLSFRQELARREAASRGVAVVGEVFTVKAAA